MQECTNHTLKVLTKAHFFKMFQNLRKFIRKDKYLKMI